MVTAAPPGDTKWEPPPGGGETAPGSEKRVKYFSINPGVNVHDLTLNIGGNGESATMTQAGPGRVDYQVDIKSRDYHWAEHWGVHLVLHTTAFRLEHQIVDRAVQGGEGGSSGGSSSATTVPLGRMLDVGSSAGTSESANENIGTKMQGTYSQLIPAFFYRFDRLRVGAGLGLADVRMTGTYVTQGGSRYLFVTEALFRNRDLALNGASAYYLGRGIFDYRHADPAITYLMATLSEGNHLELLGQYLLLRGWVPSSDDMIFAGLLALLPRGGLNNLSPIEVTTLMMLGRGFTDLRVRNAMTWRIFAEFPLLWGTRMYIGFGGPSFQARGLHYRFTEITTSITYPIAW